MEEIVGQSYEENLELKKKVEHTQKEVTLMSLNNLRKEDMLRQLSDTIENYKELENGESTDELRKILEKMKLEKNQSHVNDFEYSFENLHVGFFQKLMETYPSLTPNERRLCAFLKLQLTTKEISLLTFKSVRAIELARIRIRKKLDLTNSDKNLHDFFLDF